MNVNISPEAIILLPVFLFSLICHEIAHAYCADLGGDDTARLHGRISLNPLVHIDPMGTVLIPILQMLSGIPLIGWAKPVPVNPLRLRSANWDILVSIAGVGVNLALAVVAAVIYRILLLTPWVPLSPAANDSITVPYLLSVMLRGFVFINLLLMLFNVLPIPPLDGSHILFHFIRTRESVAFRVFALLERFGFIILILLVYTGALWRLFLGPALAFLLNAFGFLLQFPPGWLAI